jgi:predicted nucleic acid-binding protein
VILDLIANRNPFYDSIAKLVTLADDKKLVIVSSPLSFTTVEYILSKYESSEMVLGKLRKFKIICEICDVNEAIVEKALNSNFNDFEDAIQYYSALNSNCTLIITRNAKDFKKSSIPIMSAEEFLSSVNF